MTNNELHLPEHDAWERGYKDALLDVYLFLSGNEASLDIPLEKFNLIAAMADQITAASTGRLAVVEEISA